MKSRKLKNEVKKSPSVTLHCTQSEGTHKKCIYIGLHCLDPTVFRILFILMRIRFRDNGSGSGSGFEQILIFFSLIFFCKITITIVHPWHKIWSLFGPLLDPLSSENRPVARAIYSGQTRNLWPFVLVFFVWVLKCLL